MTGFETIDEAVIWISLRGYRKGSARRTHGGSFLVRWRAYWSFVSLDWWPPFSAVNFWWVSFSFVCESFLIGWSGFDLEQLSWLAYSFPYIFNEKVLGWYVPFAFEMRIWLLKFMVLFFFYAGGRRSAQMDDVFGKSVRGFSHSSTSIMFLWCDFFLQHWIWDILLVLILGPAAVDEE